MSNIELFTPSKSYKPHRFPWAYDFWEKQNQVHWLPAEVPLGEDVRDWAQNLTGEEKKVASVKVV